MDGQEHIRFERTGSAAIIRLDRPRALNSLTLPMVRAMKAALARHAADDAVSCVVLAGEGERGLCAGGDVRVIHDLGRSGEALARIDAALYLAPGHAETLRHMALLLRRQGRKQAAENLLRRADRHTVT